MKDFKEKACLCALNRIFGFEPKIALALISHLGSASEVFRLSSKEIDSLTGPYSRYRGLIVPKAMENSAIELERLSKEGISFCGWTEDTYPDLLR
jgi:predicted Rossmann fold nucleotide-binding protein DprA/Smf involved in DNA uptake